MLLADPKGGNNLLDFFFFGLLHPLSKVCAFLDQSKADPLPAPLWFNEPLPGRRWQGTISYFQFHCDEERSKILSYLWLAERWISIPRAAKEVVYSDPEMLFSRGRQGAAIWKSWDCCAWAMPVTVPGVEIRAHGHKHIPSVEHRENGTQPVNTGEATEPGTIWGMQEEAVQLSGVFKNRKVQIAVLWCHDHWYLPILEDFRSVLYL